MQQKEPLFKGMTRPAMIFGIPLMPFMGTMLIGFVFSVWVDLRFLFVLIPAFIIMKSSEIIKIIEKSILKI